MPRIFKSLIKTVIILSVIVFILLGIPLILFHMDTVAPLDDYNDTAENGFYQGLDENLTALIVDTNQDTLPLRVTDSFLNRVIQKQLSAGNTKFQVAGFESEPEYSYMVVYQSIFAIKGVWTTLSNDQLKITAGADLLLNGEAAYSTGMELIFNIVLAENNEYFLQIATIQIGTLNLPNKQAFDFASSIVSMITNKSLNDMITEQLTFGEFNQDDLSLVVGETSLTEALYTIDPTMAALLKLVYRESLLVLDISDDGFDIILTLGDFRRLLTDQDAPAHTPWTTDADKVAFMADLAEQAVTNAFLNPFNPYIDLSEGDINSILDYTLGEDVQFDLPFEFNVAGLPMEYTFASTSLFLRMNDDVLTASLRMSLTKTGTVGSFDMQYNLNTTVSMNGSGDMVLTIIDSNLGTIDINNETLLALISTFSSSLMVDNTLVIPEAKVNEMFLGSGIAINDSTVVGGALRLHYGLA